MSGSILSLVALVKKWVAYWSSTNAKWSKRGQRWKKNHPFVNHPVKEINDRRLCLIELLFYPLSNLPIICLHYPLLFYSTHPELPSLSVSSYQLSFSYGSIYSNILSLVLGTIVDGCRLKLRWIVALAIQMRCILPLSSLALRMFVNAKPCFLPSASLSIALSLPCIYHFYVLWSSQKEKSHPQCCMNSPFLPPTASFCFNH